MPASRPRRASSSNAMSFAMGFSSVGMGIGLFGGCFHTRTDD